MKIARISEIVGRLKDDGTLRALVGEGLVSTKVVTYYEINARVEMLRAKSKRVKKQYIVDSVASEFNVDRGTVYRAMRIMAKCCKNG